jgi:hypothetical protein
VVFGIRQGWHLQGAWRMTCAASASAAVCCSLGPRGAHRAPLGPPGSAAVHRGQQEGGSRGRLDGCLNGVGVICSRQRAAQAHAYLAGCSGSLPEAAIQPDPHPTLPTLPTHPLLRATASVPAMPSPLAPKSFTLNLAG